MENVNENTKQEQPITMQNAQELFNSDVKTLTFENYHKDKIKVNFYLLDQDTIFINDTYPYGRSRTLRKVYVETTNRGDRFITQTLNPKTNLWNKPKKSTYYAIKIHVLNSEGKNSTLSLDFNDSISKIKAFEEMFKDQLNLKQKEKLAEIKAYNKVMENVTFEVKKNYFKHKETGVISESISILEFNKYEKCDKEGNLINQELEDQKQKEVKKTINNQINMLSYLNKKEMGLRE